MIDTNILWEVILRRLNRPDEIVTALPPQMDRGWNFEGQVDDFSVSVLLRPEQGGLYFLIRGTHPRGEAGHFVLRCTYGRGEAWNFNAPVTADAVYRQSPHDPDAWISDGILKQAVPLIALNVDGRITGAFSSSPAEYKNFTSQGFHISRKTLELSSGDSGRSLGSTISSGDVKKEYNLSGDQRLSPGKILSYDHPMSDPHVFEGCIISGTGMEFREGVDPGMLRRLVNTKAASVFCCTGEKGDGFDGGYFEKLSAATAYMNLRYCESGTGGYQVVPAVEYSNIQYGRDAFWIAFMLEPEYAASCLRVELAKADRFAEYPLFTILWAYRLRNELTGTDLKSLGKVVGIVEEKAADGWYCAFDPSDGRLDFQHWGDVMAFDSDDVICYNQGLLAAALSCAERMGIPLKILPAQAAENYRSMFNQELGFFPISRKKNRILSPDVLVGDLLAGLLLDAPLLDTKNVLSHYEAMVAVSKTPFGFKTVCLPDGSYLPSEMYNAGDYIAQINREPDITDGTYFRGGSYFLYDNLFLLDVCRHRIPGAVEELIDRIRLDFSIGGTTYECINTKTGEPWKPNMGWNGAICALLRIMIIRGFVDKEVMLQIDQN